MRPGAGIRGGTAVTGARAEESHRNAPTGQELCAEGPHPGRWTATGRDRNGEGSRAAVTKYHRLGGAVNHRALATSLWAIIRCTTGLCVSVSNHLQDHPLANSHQKPEGKGGWGLQPTSVSPRVPELAELGTEGGQMLLSPSQPLAPHFAQGSWGPSNLNESL